MTAYDVALSFHLIGIIANVTAQGWARQCGEPADGGIVTRRGIALGPFRYIFGIRTLSIQTSFKRRIDGQSVGAWQRDEFVDSGRSYESGSAAARTYWAAYNAAVGRSS